MARKLEWWKIETNDDCSKMVGRIVYEHYTPTRVGRIIECYMGNVRYQLPGGRYFDKGPEPIAKVKWLKQTKKYPEPITEISLSSCNDFEALIEDHKKKYENHLETYKKVLYL